ncbi:MAG: serine/threonine-protein kinase [Planctomycetota bacterium]
MALSPEDHKRVRALFHELYERSPAERAEILQRAAPSPEVRAEVEYLLDDLTQAGFAEGDLCQANEALLDAAVPGPTMPRTIGPYRVVRPVGEGGMGVVYLAEQLSPQRLVAVKLLRHMGLGVGGLRRFEREAELLGRLQHPGIAQIFEAGTTPREEGGVTYIAMEFVAGVPITEFVRRRSLGQTARVRLLVSLAQAVHHAHVRGVLHRDLKPSNVLVTDQGVVKVIDFGIARPLDAAQATQPTMTGQVIGTLSYMSPEQARGDVAGFDARTDVYALGVMAYELLSGQLPHDVSGRPVTEIARIINEIEPDRLGALEPSCRGDLELIVAKAMAKEPERRYQSAASLAEDWERHLHYQPIEARPTSVVYQMRRFARRHRAVVAGAAATLLAIVVGAGVAVHYAIRNADLAAAQIGLRQVADDKAAEAARLQKQAEQRAEEMTRIAAYQDSLVSGIDLRQMGLDLVADLRGSLERELQRGRVEDQDVTAALADLDGSLARVNPTEVARQTLQRVLFDRARQAIEERFEPDSHLKMRVLQSLGSTLFDFGLVRPASEIFRRVVEGCADDPAKRATRFAARIDLGVTMRRLDRMDEADVLQRENLAEAEAAFGIGSAEWRRAQVEVASVLSRQGDQTTASAMLREALEGVEQHDRVTLSALGLLATCLTREDRVEEALAVRQQAYEGYVRLSGDRHLNTLTTLSGVAEDLAFLGRYDEARRTAREAHAALQEVVGDDHASTVSCLEVIAMTYLSEERTAEALPISREIWEACRRLFGDEHPRTFNSLSNLAQATVLAGDWTEALRLTELLVAQAEARQDPRLRHMKRMLRGIRQELANGVSEASATAAPQESESGGR